MPKRGDWTYAPEGTNYPVQPGQIWAVGPHRLVCDDLVETEGRLLRQVMAEIPPTLVYTDPPWQQGNLNSFRTKAGREPAAYQYTDLYKAIVGLADVPLWLESGTREQAIISSLLPGPVTAIFPVTYYRKHASALHYSGPVPAPVDPSGLDDDYTPGRVLDAYPVGVVMDPCTGRGLTPRTAHKHGWTFIGSELSQYRASVTLTRLGKESGQEPRRVD